MSNLNLHLTVTHTIDPAAIASLSELFNLRTAPAQTNTPQTTPAPAPTPQTTPTPAPTPQAASPSVTPIPTAAPTFTIDQISQAAALFADGAPENREAVLALMNRYNADMLTTLTEGQYGAFATELRALGAKI